MSTTDPLSLTEAKRLAGNADALLLRATRPADLETPIGAFLRLDDGTTPAYLLESVEGGERLGRYSFLGVGPRRLLEVRPDRAERLGRHPRGVDGDDIVGVLGLKGGLVRVVEHVVGRGDEVGDVGELPAEANPGEGADLGQVMLPA